MIFEKNLFGFDFEKWGLERGFIFLKKEGEVWFEVRGEVMFGGGDVVV